MQVSTPVDAWDDRVICLEDRIISKLVASGFFEYEKKIGIRLLVWGLNGQMTYMGRGILAMRGAKRGAKDLAKKWGPGMDTGDYLC